MPNNIVYALNELKINNLLNEPAKCIVLDEINSTNSYLIDKKSTLQNYAVVTLNQTNGRGRLDRRWIGSKNKQLALSYAFQYPIQNIYQTPLILEYVPMLTSIAIVNAFIESGFDASIKWPNDLIVDGKKVCGILIELSQPIAVIGIGVNLSLSSEEINIINTQRQSWQLEVGNISDQKVDLDTFVSNLINNLNSILTEFKNTKAFKNKIQDLYRKNCQTLGKKITFNKANEVIAAFALDITEKGELIVELENGNKMIVNSADISQLGT